MKTRPRLAGIAFAPTLLMVSRDIARYARVLRRRAALVAVRAAASVVLTGLGLGQSIVAWGNSSWGLGSVPPLPNGVTYVELAAGDYHTVARCSDGSVITWGGDIYGSGVLNVPALPPGLTYVEVAAGYNHTVARRSDGSVVAWGQNGQGQCVVPVLPTGVTYAGIAAGGLGHSVAVRSDGSVVAWGWNAAGQCNVLPLPAGLSYVEVAAGYHHTVARRSDGSVVAWGSNAFGQCNIPALPGGVSYVEIAANGGQTVARRSDGVVVAVGYNSDGQCNVPALPPGVSYVQIAAGGTHTLALRSDGAIVAFGQNYVGECNVPALANGLACVEICAGLAHSLARVGLAASSVSVGAGCGGAGSPVFACSAPRIGQNMTFGLTQGSANAAGFVFFSGVPPTPLSLGSGCAIELDVTAFGTLASLATNGSGFWESSATVSLDPGLVGLQGALQIALLGTAGPLGLDLSNGLIVTIGY